MIEIVPTIIPESLDDIRSHMKLVVGLVPMVQIDVTDGKYVDSVTWPYHTEDAEEFEKIVTESEGFPFWDKLDFEVDMMVENSPSEVERWIHAGASRVIIHIESTDDVDGCISKADELNTEVAIAIKPSTPSLELVKWLSRVCAVQFMGNDELGMHGVELDKKVLEKIHTFHEENPSVTLAIDIGVREETIPKLAQVGVTRFASGSAVFDSEDIRSNIEHLKSLVE